MAEYVLALTLSLWTGPAGDGGSQPSVTSPASGAAAARQKPARGRRYRRGRRPPPPSPKIGGRKLIVGTTEMPPFSMRNEEGQWEGVAIDLWMRIAPELNVTYELKELPASDL